MQQLVVKICTACLPLQKLNIYGQLRGYVFLLQLFRCFSIQICNKSSTLNVCMQQLVVKISTARLPLRNRTSMASLLEKAALLCFQPSASEHKVGEQEIALNLT